MVHYDLFTACVETPPAHLCSHLFDTADMILKMSVWIGIIYEAYIKL